MGHHYIPRRYLQGFNIPEDNSLIYMYDKKTLTIKCLPITIIAQEKGYYSSEVELALANDIELPANIVIHSMIDKQQMVDRYERAHLSIYLASLFTRVPNYRARVDSVIPEVKDFVFNNTEDNLKQLENDHEIDPEILAALRKEIEHLKVKYKTKLPQEWYQTLAHPFVSVKIAQGIFEMHWFFIKRDSRHQLVTSDNPVFYFDDLGVGNPTSELTFPISKDILLWATNSKYWIECFRGNSRDYFKEANNRTIFKAFRFIYASSHEDWINELIKMPKQLHQLGNADPMNPIISSRKFISFR